MNFDGVKVFTATKHKEREGLGEKLTKWLNDNEGVGVTDVEVRQSSDSEFHCLSIVVFYRGELG